MKLFAAVLALMLSGTAARAWLTQADLSSVSASPLPGAALDLDLVARDTGGRQQTIREILDGRPAFLVFVDYSCNTICGVDLQFLAAAIQHAQLEPSQYRLIVMGIDPRDSAQAASAMEADEIPPALRPAAIFLLPDKSALARATSALGYHYVYDPVLDQFAHPAVTYLIGPDGDLRGVISPLALTTADVNQLFKPAAVPTLYQRIRILCYAYDPATGVYSASIGTLLRIAATATLLLLGGAVVLLIRRGNRVG